MWVQPTSEELFSRFTPEIQARTLAERGRAEEDFQDFINKIKEYSKSDKPIWIAAADEEDKDKRHAQAQLPEVVKLIQLRREELREDRRREEEANKSWWARGWGLGGGKEGDGVK